MSTIWNFKGKAALVTGGQRGLGRAIADGLQKNGALVYVLDRDDAPIPGMHCLKGNIANAAEIEGIIKSLPQAPLLLVNNAGITRDRTILKMSAEEWQSVIDVNLSGAFNLIKALAPLMVEASYGRIVNITSINGIRGKFGQANYCSAKAGLIGLTKTAAREFGPKGITVNAIAPGMVLTEMALALANEVREKALAETALKRLAEPSDIAEAVMFLLSDSARMITGEVIKVDSGQYI